MRKCGAVLRSGYYNSACSPVLDLPNAGARKEELLERERERKKVLIQLSPEALNVAFGEQVSKKEKPCSDYTPRTKGHIAAYNDVWKYPKHKHLVASRPASASELSRGRNRGQEMDTGELSLTVSSPTKASNSRKAPVSIHLSPSPHRSPSPSARRTAESDSRMQVDCPSEGVQIKVNTPRNTPQAAASPSLNVSTQHFHLENNPAQSVTVRSLSDGLMVTLKDINVRSQALKDGVQFQLDGRPGVQLSIKMGQPTKGGSATRNSIKIETQMPDNTNDPYGLGEYGGGRWAGLLSYQRPTVSHLIHARMTQLYKELRKSLMK